LGDIGRPQCHKCTEKQKILGREKRVTWHCGWSILYDISTPMSPKCYPLFSVLDFVGM